MTDPFSEYRMRPMDDGSIRVYYPVIRKGKPAFTILGDFIVEKKGLSLEEIGAEIVRKSEELVKKYIAQQN